MWDLRFWQWWCSRFKWSGMLHCVDWWAVLEISEDCTGLFSAESLACSSLSTNIKLKIHRTIIVPCCLYGWGTSSLTLSKKHRLRVFKNRVLWKIFGPKRDRVTKEWRRQHNKKLYDLYFSPNIIQVIKPRSLRWLGYVACMRDCMVAIQCYWGNLRKKITWRT